MASCGSSALVHPEMSTRTARLANDAFNNGLEDVGDDMEDALMVDRFGLKPVEVYSMRIVMVRRDHSLSEPGMLMMISLPWSTPPLISEILSEWLIPTR